MRKKAVVFSIMSVLLVILFVLTNETLTQFNVQESKLEVNRARIKVLNSIVDDMEMYYFKNILEITAKNALYGITSYYERNNYNNINT